MHEYLGVKWDTTVFKLTDILVRYEEYKIKKILKLDMPNCFMLILRLKKKHRKKNVVTVSAEDTTWRSWYLE